MNPQIDGDPGAPILVIGMAPGEHELEEGRPFVGPSGKLLWQAAERAGFSRADCYIVNTIGEIQTGSSPTPEQFAKYWDLFNKAVALSSARVALVLGGDAFWRMTGWNVKITSCRGYVIDRADLGTSIQRPELLEGIYKSGKNKGKVKRWVDWKTVPLILPKYLTHIIPTLHPAAIIRTGYKAVPVIMYDVDRAWRAYTGQLRMGKASPGTVAFDIENTMTPIGWGAITRIGFTTPAGSWSKPWGGGAYKDADTNLGMEGIVKVGHNLAHDISYLNRIGIKVEGPLFDTMLAAQLLQPDLYKGLESVASLYLDIPRWKHLNDTNQELYNTLDTVHTASLYTIFKEELKETGQLAFFENTIMRAVPALIAMKEHGIKVDRATLHFMNQLTSSKVKHLTEQWHSQYPMVSPTSPHQLKKLFYDQLKYPVQKKGKRPSTDEDALKKLLEKTGNKAIELLLDLREANKALSTFLTPKLWADGCVHPTYLPISKDADVYRADAEPGEKGIAGTGRIQASGGIQQVPKEFRVIYVPHSLDNVLAEFDYEQAELRVVAAMSRDRALQEALEGPDLHTVHAERWGCSRFEAKTVTYAVLYGAKEYQIQKTLRNRGTKKTLKECKRLLDQFFADYPDVAYLRNCIIEEVMKTNLLANPFGRHRYFWQVTADIPAALDFYPQSVVADIMWTILPDIHNIAEGIGGKLLTIVHDSVLLELPATTLSRGVEMVETVMTREFPMVAPGFSLPVSIKVGDNWGTMKAYNAVQERCPTP